MLPRSIIPNGPTIKALNAEIQAYAARRKNVHLVSLAKYVERAVGPQVPVLRRAAVHVPRDAEERRVRFEATLARARRAALSADPRQGHAPDLAASTEEDEGVRTGVDLTDRHELVTGGPHAVVEHRHVGELHLQRVPGHGRHAEPGLLARALRPAGGERPDRAELEQRGRAVHDRG